MSGRIDRRSDRELLRRTHAGDHDAFAVFYRRHRPAILAYLRKHSRRDDPITDLVSETFAAALLAVQRGRAQELDVPLAWLLRIARNKLIDGLRRRRLEETLHDELASGPLAAADDDLERIDDASAGRAALRALEQLPATHRDAVLARVIDERAYEEIAAELACSPDVVRQRVSRALRVLNGALRTT